MSLSRLEAIYSWINRIGPNTKTTIIIVLTLVCLEITIRDHTKLILKDYSELVREDKQLAEEYTKMITPELNTYIEGILNKDKDASNVILLNYHNTLTSTHGFSYYYLTALAEKKRGLDTRSCKRYWKELEYVTYGEEIEKINDNQYLRMDDVSKYNYKLPNIVELLNLCNAKSAALYPIVGINGPIGMIVVMYPTSKIYGHDYYSSTIAKNIQPLVTYLDYNSVRIKFKKMYDEGIFIPEALLK